MKTLFSKWYFWLALAAGAGFYFFRRQPAAAAAPDIYGAADNARQATAAALASYSAVATDSALDPVIQKVKDRLIYSTNTAIDQGQDRPTASAELSFLATTLQNLKAVK